LTGRTIIESNKEPSMFGIGGKSITPVRGPIYQHMDPSPMLNTEQHQMNQHLLQGGSVHTDSMNYSIMKPEVIIPQPQMMGGPPVEQEYYSMLSH
jgi:hypothetical protein